MDIMSSISNRMLLSVLFVFRKSKKNDDNNDNDNVHQHQHQKHSSSSTSLFLRVVKITIGIIFISFLILFLLSFGIGRVPLHWFGYQGASHAGPDSVYLPGGGFSGFWFHLGYLHSIPSESLHEHDYYCYSAGCLGILSVFLNRSLDDVYNFASNAQNAWRKEQKISRFDLVDYFFDELVPQTIDDHDFGSNNTTTTSTSTIANTNLESFLPRIKILVTTISDGYQVVEAKNRQELKEHIMKTTFVPYLTGWGLFLRTNTNDDDDDDMQYYLDGGFSRMLHPKCDIELHVPIMIETLFDTFNPSLTHKQVTKLYKKGYEYELYDDNDEQQSSLRRQRRLPSVSSHESPVPPLLKNSNSSLSLSNSKITTTATTVTIATKDAGAAAAETKETAAAYDDEDGVCSSNANAKTNNNTTCYHL